MVQEMVPDVVDDPDVNIFSNDIFYLRPRNITHTRRVRTHVKDHRRIHDLHLCLGLRFRTTIPRSFVRDVWQSARDQCIMCILQCVALRLLVRTEHA